jgi:hypothetical protein
MDTIAAGTIRQSGATQVCPALKSLRAMIERAARWKSASGSTIAGDLPPSSSVTGVRFSAASDMTRPPVAAEPVLNSPSSGRCVSATAASLPPRTTRTRSPTARSTTWTMSAAIRGMNSDSRKMHRLPPASAATRGTSASWSG